MAILTSGKLREVPEYATPVPHNFNIPALNKTFTNNGASNVVAAAANGGDAQIWHFVKNDNGTYRIESKKNGFYFFDGKAELHCKKIAQKSNEKTLMPLRQRFCSKDIWTDTDKEENKL